MQYLFNDNSNPKPSPADIWLTSEGNPVFVNRHSSDRAVPAGHKLQGKIEAAESEPYQLSKDGLLTKTGKIYCQIMGVATPTASVSPEGAKLSSSSLEKFISGNQSKKVCLDAVIPNTLEVA